MAKNYETPSYDYIIIMKVVNIPTIVQQRKQFKEPIIGESWQLLKLVKNKF